MTQEDACVRKYFAFFHILCYPQSLHKDNVVRINISGGRGPPQWSKAGLKQGRPPSPTPFGLIADGLHGHLKAHCPDVGIDVNGGCKVAVLGYADDFMADIDSAEGWQWLTDATEDLCGATYSATNMPKSMTMVFLGGSAQHATWCERRGIGAGGYLKVYWAPFQSSQWCSGFFCLS